MGDAKNAVKNGLKKGRFEIADYFKADALASLPMTVGEVTGPAHLVGKVLSRRVGSPLPPDKPGRPDITMP
jgi:hypothetical protein